MDTNHFVLSLHCFLTIVFEGVYCTTSTWLSGTIRDLKQKRLYHTAIYQLLQYRQYRVGQFYFKAFRPNVAPLDRVTYL